jgi:SAM-dependent methyltransferase
MAADAHGMADFYRTSRGDVTARLLRARIAAMWPEITGCSVLGMGYTAPYLRAWEDGAAYRRVALTPAQIGTIRWPPDTPNLSCTAEEDALPFADLVFDRILIVHGLEAADNARRLVREVWRVLKDDGRLLIVTPNRTGMWAYWESTPFGHGQPYTSGQLGRLLAGGLFRVERQDTALWMPPSRARIILRSASLFERVGRRLMPGLAGVTITEAVKDVYAAMPLRPSPRRRLVRVETP